MTEPGFDDMTGIYAKMDARRQPAFDPFKARDTESIALCNTMLKIKQSFPGLQQRISGLSETDPEMSNYIKQIEALAAPFIMKYYSAGNAATAPPRDDELEQIVAQAESAHSALARIRSEVLSWETRLQDLQRQINKLTNKTVQTTTVAPPAVAPPAVTSARPQLSFDGFDTSELRNEAPKFEDLTANLLGTPGADDLLA